VTPQRIGSSTASLARVCAAALLGWAVLGLAACGSEPAPPARSVLLVTFDTTRPDAFGCCGGSPGVTPHVDALAAEGIVYTSARTVAPLTLPAHASMLSGLVPLRHGLRDNGLAALAPAAVTLAELAQARGLATGAFVGSLVLDRSYGLDQGFEVYDGPAGGADARDFHYGERPADAVADAALAWLGGAAREREFFCWLHFYDPHAPHKGTTRAAVAGEPPGWSAYLSEVSACDAALGRVLELLRAQGRLERTSVLVSADHGEAFGAHGEETHGVYAYDSTLRVPFVLRRADRARAGTRDPSAVSVVDVYPTLADALGLECPPSDGVSVWSEPAPEQRVAYCESYFPWLAYGWSGLSGAWDAQAKYLHSSKPELYELASDADEQRNLLPAADARAEPYRAALAALARKGRLPTAVAGSDHAAALQKLGYVGASAGPAAWPEPLEVSTRRAPIDGKQELGQLMRAAALGAGARWLEALAKLEPVLAANPSNWKALDHRAYALLQLNRHAEALALYERLEREGPVWPATSANLATCYLALGRPTDALVQLDLRLQVDPADSWSLEAAARAAREIADEPRALDYERRLAALGKPASK
jgi:arylsulfatase A-like enzyme